MAADHSPGLMTLPVPDAQARRPLQLPEGSLTLAVLLVVSAAAWLATAAVASDEMTRGVLTGATTAMPDAAMADTSMGARAFAAGWSLMMVAMMVPSTWPAVRSLGRRSAGSATLLVIGYLLVWIAAGAAAYVLVWAVQAASAHGDLLVRPAAALLAVAGLYQFTALRKHCLRRCRSEGTAAPPKEPAHPRRGWGPFMSGLVQGMSCVGSSWPLMLALVLVGMMNLAWMGLIAAIIFVEKVVARPAAIARVVGTVLVGGGLALLASGHPLG